VAASPGALNLGESEAGPSSQTVTLTNSGDSAVTYTLSYEDTVATYGDPTNPTFGYAPSQVDLPSEVPVAAGGQATYEVPLAPYPGLQQPQCGGYVVLTPAEREPLRLPYAVFAGD